MPAAERRRLPGRRRRPRRLPGLRGPHGHRLRPGGADARLDGAPARAVPGCARSRWRSTSPTTSCSRLGQPIHGYDADKLAGPDPGPPGAARGRRLTTLDGVDRDVSTEDLAGHRRLRAHRPRRRDGRRDHRDVRRPPPTCWSRRRTGTPSSMFRTGKRHKLTSEAGKRNERGVDPRAAGGGRRPGRRAAGRATAAARSSAGVTVVGGAAGRADRSRIADDLPARVTGMPIAAADRGRAPRGGRLRRRASTATPADRDAAAVAPRPHRPLRPGRGGRPGRRATTRCRRCCRRRRPARGLTRAQRLRRRVGRTLAGAGCVEVVSFPFVGDARLRRARAARPTTTRAHTGAAGQPALVGGAGVHHDAAARPAQGGRPQHRPRRARTSRCSRPATVDPSRATAARRRSTASTGGPPTTSWPS